MSRHRKKRCHVHETAEPGQSESALLNIVCVLKWVCLFGCLEDQTSRLNWATIPAVDKWEELSHVQSMRHYGG